MTNKIKQLYDMMKSSAYTVVLTGAGISTDSGLADFRSQKGLWDGKDPLTISSEKALYEDTDNVVDFFSKRIEDIASHSPNSAHYLLAQWEEKGFIQSILTQNIDGYHKAASSKKVIELHGHLRHLECSDCGTQYPLTVYTSKEPVQCSVTIPYEEDICKGIIRPPVVLFGETLPALEFFNALQEMNKSQLVIAMGTSLEVHPFASLISEAKDFGAKVAIINKSKTAMDEKADLVINGSITDTLTSVNPYFYHKGRD